MGIGEAGLETELFVKKIPEHMIVKEAGCGWRWTKLGGGDGEGLPFLKAVERPLEEQALLIKSFWFSWNINSGTNNIN